MIYGGVFLVANANLSLGAKPRQGSAIANANVKGLGL